jgi:multiple sugar transport system substrate-binding protein
MLAATPTFRQPMTHIAGEVARWMKGRSLMGTHASKRRTIVAAGVVAAATALAACGGGGGGGSDGPVSLTMTVWGGDLDQKTYTERLELAEKKFPDIDIKLELVADAYDQKLQTRVAGGNAPDIIQLAESVNVYASKGQLVDLAPAFAEAGIDVNEEFGESTASIFQSDGKLWAAPDRSGAMVLYYNKDHFDEAGLDYPTEDWTWEDFRDAARELTKRDGDNVQQWGFAAGDWWAWYMTFMYQNGGRILDDAGEPVINSPENIEALQFYHDIVFEDGSAPTPRDYANMGLSDSQADPLFVQGRLSMVTTGFWSVPAYDEVAELNFGVAPLWQGEEQATPAFFSGLAVSAASDHQDEAIEVVQFLTSPEGQEPIAANAEDVPASLEVASSDAFVTPAWLEHDVDLSAFSDSAAFTYVPPLVPQFNEILKAFSDNMSPVWAGEQPVEEGMNNVQTAVEKIMAG